MIFYFFMNCILVLSKISLLCRLIVTLFTFVSYSVMHRLLVSGKSIFGYNHIVLLYVLTDSVLLDVPFVLTDNHKCHM